MLDEIKNPLVVVIANKDKAAMGIKYSDRQERGDVWYGFLKVIERFISILSEFNLIGSGYLNGEPSETIAKIKKALSTIN